MRQPDGNGDGGRLPPSLNEYQRQGITTALRSVEEHVRRIEKMLQEGDYAGILYRWENDLTGDAILRLSAVIPEVRAAIGQAAGRFSLPVKHRRASDEAFGGLPPCWEILEETKAKRLARYGEVAEGLAGELDPLVETIIGLILEMEGILQRVRAAR